MSIEIRECANCGNVFNAKMHLRTRFCSTRCCGIARTGQPLPRKKPVKSLPIECRVCGTVFLRYPSQTGKREKKYCSRQCSSSAVTGAKRLPFSEEHKRKISESHKDVSGSNNPRWRGGITKDSMKWRSSNSTRFAAWRAAVIKRDKGKCKECGSTKRLEAHHIVPVVSNR